VKGKNMKNSIAILSLSALMAASVQTASAGHGEWSTAGKVLTGIAAASVTAAVVAQAVQPAPQPAVVYGSPGYTVAPGPVVVTAPIAPVYYVQPAPVVAYAQPVYVVPRPVVVAPPLISVGLSFGHPHYSHYSRRHCW
jgi:hypothetical protein